MAGILSLAAADLAPAQTAVDGPNSGALRFTGGLDAPSVYVFRGFTQERDPKVTLWPYGDIGLALRSHGGGLRSLGVNFGVWNSLQTGSAGLDGPSRRLHYEENFYTTLNLGFGGGLTVGTTFMALTSPNGMFTTVKEFQLIVAKSGMLAPYGFLATELTDEGQADAGSHKGTYLELGVGPSFVLMKDGPTLAIPVKIGVSLKDYYEGPTGDNKFGFFDLGGLLTIPIKGVSGKFGAWNLHGGADYLRLGDTTELFNVNTDGEVKKNKIVALVGIGVRY